MDKNYHIGLVGARGFVGREVLRLVHQHPQLTLAFASSRELAGRPLGDVADIESDQVFETLSAEDVAASNADVIVLALPNEASAPFVAAIDEHAADKIIIDLSADYRFDNNWAYGLPELYGEREKLKSARRISNPGCYATAGQVGVFPLLKHLAAPPSIFGVSGYSGAGTTPSDKNNPDILKDNLLPYGLTGHIHEKEMSHHLSQQVRFTPHVHPAFSGILATIHLSFNTPQSAKSMLAAFEATYANTPLIKVQEAVPTLKDGTGINGLVVGGFATSDDGLHGVVVVAEDNLLKGAAVQALQNINLSLGFEMMTGLSKSS
jgi:N-acetyl-gamma-glutamyl-phosphate reductase